MADRKRLHAVKPTPKPAVTFSMLRKAVSLYRNDMVPREQWKKNAAKWLRSMLMLGDRHILKGGKAGWGQPGERMVSQVLAPRRLGESK